MSGKSKLLSEILDRNPKLWTELWIDYSAYILAVIARGFITKLYPLKVEPNFSEIDNSAFRIERVDYKKGCAFIAESLSNSEELRNACKDVLDKFSIKLRKHEINSIVEIYLSDKAMVAVSELTQLHTGLIYKHLSFIIEKELFLRLIINENINQKELLNILLIINCLRSWGFPAKYFSKQISLCSRPELCLGANLVGIPSTISESNLSVSNNFIETPYKDISIRPEIRNMSCLLTSVENESRMINSRAGFVHRDLNLDAPLTSENAESATRLGLVKDKTSQFRTLAYNQYEYYSLIFNSLSCIEFLIRSYSNDPASDEKDIPSLAANIRVLLGDDIVECINNTFSDGTNLRNRVMHGAFFDVESQRFDLVLNTDLLNHLGVSQRKCSNTDFPENISNYLVQLIERIALKLDPSLSSLAWIEKFKYTDDDIYFARHLYCDILQGLDVAMTWNKKIHDHINATCPFLSTPIKLGLVGWFKDKKGAASVELLPPLSFLFLLYEPLLRITLLRKGVDVLQYSKANILGNPAFCFKYKMLDESGLMSKENQDLLTKHLNSKEKTNALKTLELAQKARNAFAHGAITQIDENVHVLQGHIMIKSIQLLVEASYQ